MQAKVKPLRWSEPAKPNSECSYDHVIAETPFGRILITWKSWKDFDSPTIDESPWGFGGCGHDVAHAKEIAQAAYSRLILEGIENATD